MIALDIVRSALKNLLVRESVLPEEFATGFDDPQREISVMLDCMGEPIDVTFSHSTACSDPLLIAVALEEDHMPEPARLRRPCLKIFERGEERKLLGEMTLRRKETVLLAGTRVLLFEPISAANYCLPRFALVMHYLLHLHRQRQQTSSKAMRMSFLQRRAAMISFIRPHPTVLASVMDSEGRNFFPMNIMGALGPGRFGFALRKDRFAGQLIERAGCLAISNVSVRYGPLVYSLAANHIRWFVPRDEVPFAAKSSQIFDLPVPKFAQRVRELKVERTYQAGSHTFYMTKIVSDNVFSSEPSLSIVHGFYQTRRLKGRPAEMHDALAEDHRNKHGVIITN